MLSHGRIIKQEDNRHGLGNQHIISIADIMEEHRGHGDKRRGEVDWSEIS